VKKGYVMPKDLMKKTIEMKKILEDIIDIYARNDNTLSTQEVHSELQVSHKYTKDIKTTSNYLKRLKAGAIEGVSLTIKTRGKHVMQDLRDANQYEMLKDREKTAIEHQKKLESKKVLYAEEQTYLRLAMESIKELDTLSSKHHNEIEKRLGLCSIESPYFIDNDNMESVNMSNPDILALKSAIREDATTEFKYDGKSRKDWYVVEPYKLLIFDGLWYLFGKDIHDKQTPYKTWRLIYIRDIDYTSDIRYRHNMDDKHTEEILKNIDDANFIVDATQKIPTVHKNITVRLKIYSEIIDKFDHKAHIPGDVSEPIIQKDGSLIITTKVNTILDVDAEIKSWLPYIEVLEPLEYKKSFKDSLLRYLEKLS